MMNIDVPAGVGTPPLDTQQLFKKPPYILKVK